MGKIESKTREFTQRQAHVTLRGLLVILLPAVFVTKSLEHVHKALVQALSLIAPEYKMVGDIGIAVVLLLAILGACWLFGWLMSVTELGQRVIEWERTKFLNRSPLLKNIQQLDKETSKPVQEKQPALAHVAGGWQPGVIVEESSEGWITLYLPDVPSASTGRLYCLPEAQVVRLDMTLDAFRGQLNASGQGSKAWLQTLSAAQPPVP